MFNYTRYMIMWNMAKYKYTNMAAAAVKINLWLHPPPHTHTIPSPICQIVS